MSGFARPSDARLSASAARALPNPSMASLAAETTRSAPLAGRARPSAFPQPRDPSPQPRALVRLEKRAVPRNPAPAASHR